MKTPQLPFLAAVTLTLASCAVTTEDTAPLIAGERQEARMQLMTQGANLTPPDWTAGEEAWDPDREAEPLPTLNVRTRLLAVEPELAERLLGHQATSLVATLTKRADTDEALGILFEAGELPGFAEIEQTMVTLREGQTGNISVVNQEAYVESFELVVSGNTAIADPQVGVLHDGLLLVVNAAGRPGGEGVDLDLELTLSEFERPFDVRKVQLVSAAAPVEIQVPRGLVRRLSTSACMQADEVFVIGGAALPVEDSRVLVALVAVERVSLD